MYAPTLNEISSTTGLSVEALVTLSRFGGYPLKDGRIEGLPFRLRREDTGPHGQTARDGWLSLARQYESVHEFSLPELSNELSSREQRWLRASYTRLYGRTATSARKRPRERALTEASKQHGPTAARIIYCQVYD